MDVPLGTWNLKVSAPGRPDLTTPCQLDANSVYTVLLVDRDGALKAELLTDSAGSKVVPSGGVNAGNARDFLAAGALAVSAGTDVVSPADVAAGNWQDITTKAATFVAALG